jgi:putative nucleotidyltransferase with HDIG domain
MLHALETIASVPAAAVARRRAMEILDRPHVNLAELVLALEDDPPLALSVFRRANEGGAEAASVSAAVCALPLPSVRAAIEAVPAWTPADELDDAPLDAEALRIHAVTTCRIADRIAVAVGVVDREELALVALLHDLGKLAMLAVFPRYREVLNMPTTIDQLLALERRRYGLDHAALGAWFVGRFGAPARTANAVARHHADDAHDIAGVVRLADMLAHHQAGDAIGHAALRAGARAVGLTTAAYEEIAFDLAIGTQPRAPRIGKSPLTRRQVQILDALAGGKQYKEIASEMGVAESTVRTHLHHLYKTLGVSDRAQAVLLAERSGWL